MKWVVSPGHGWLVVPVAKVRASGAEISPFSWVTRGGNAYLEEDCDADAYLDAINMPPEARDKIRVTYIDNEPRSRLSGTRV